MKIHFRTFIATIFIIILFLSAIFMTDSLVFQYADEVITVFFYICIFFKIIDRKIEKKWSIILYLLSLLVIIGVISNIFNDLNKNIFYILLDILCVSKYFICLIGMYHFVDENDACILIERFEKSIKIFVIISFFLGIISMFKDIGLSSEGHFGLNSYHSFFNYAHWFSMIIITCLLFIASSERINEKSKCTYFCLVVLQLIMTNKGISMGCAVGMVIIYLYTRKNNKIKLRNFVILGLLCCLSGSYQIKIYLMNDEVPRSMLLKYGIITANTYFPFGSGFATYGSSIITKIYSPLYYLYGFANRFGMSPEDPSFLCDNYWPMIIGQFGYFGLILTIYIYYKVFDIIRKAKLNRYMLVSCLSIYIYLLIGSIGSAIPTDSTAILMACALGICLKKVAKERKDEYQYSKD